MIAYAALVVEAGEEETDMMVADGWVCQDEKMVWTYRLHTYYHGEDHLRSTFFA